MATSVASFPDEDTYFGAGAMVAGAGVMPNLSQLHPSDNHKMIGSHQGTSGVITMTTSVYAPPPGHMSELSDLQSELEGIQAGIHQVFVFFYAFMPKACKIRCTINSH